MGNLLSTGGLGCVVLLWYMDQPQIFTEKNSTTHVQAILFLFPSWRAEFSCDAALVSHGIMLYVLQMQEMYLVSIVSTLANQYNITPTEYCVSQVQCFVYIMCFRPKLP